MQNNASEPPALKRGRGRPRKQIVENSKVLENKNNEKSRTELKKSSKPRQAEILIEDLSFPTTKKKSPLYYPLNSVESIINCPDPEQGVSQFWTEKEAF